jgi:hypothetical protein
MEDFAVCEWNPGGPGDACHEPENPGWRKVTTPVRVRILVGPDVGALYYVGSIARDPNGEVSIRVHERRPART